MPHFGPPRMDGILEFRHVLKFGTASQRIQEPFRIASETINLSLVADKDSVVQPLLRWAREADKMIEAQTAELTAFLHKVHGWRIPPYFGADPEAFPPLAGTESISRLLPWVLYMDPELSNALSSLGSVRMFQLSPSECRQPAVPTPNPQLDRSGENLPAVIQSIKQHDRAQYGALLLALRGIMPTIEDLSVDVTPQKTLGLYFHEVGFGRPWTAEEVSDGTIRAIALLAALFDPAPSVVVTEEPENSLHPWAIRQFVDACRVAAKTKQVVLTTHSPVLVNALQPSEVWVVQRPGAETMVSPLTALDPEAAPGWEQGRYTLAEYLDSGILPAAVPSGSP